MSYWKSIFPLLPPVVEQDWDDRCQLPPSLPDLLVVTRKQAATIKNAILARNAIAARLLLTIAKIDLL
ncbi:hypothetical protein SAMN05660226_00516 [Parapedobacter luteus]|uniref:Uncharacterized protein n=1 Tax=Parapedobacter luteus TaxID=623280 RepID=A0A1T5A3K2_9SPHI|nr:hypothetical protein SAMN05660226_00516 [Parapedobacter luteus]